ncbi:hypothetical protein [Anaeromyxobacter sp. PSR-1]|uniref:hypothetical protein n=1 Tax=unclassified Anaeromyxobacter TaxID=2620896 RepID=UPI0005EA3764|nr:hypothetical protein [Anaeromyxobacter sp. PSR-1]GAO03724.1 hypothetical protein PSR1_02609 [Anaeromyxobacter sp. PSR-1]
MRLTASLLALSLALPPALAAARDDRSTVRGSARAPARGGPPRGGAAGPRGGFRGGGPVAAPVPGAMPAPYARGAPAAPRAYAPGGYAYAPRGAAPYATRGAPAPYRAAPAPYYRGAPAPYPSAPAPGRGGYRGGYAVAPGVAVVAAAPFWWGWGWGYGYYPLYPSPYGGPPGTVAGDGSGAYYPPPAPDPVTLRLDARVAAVPDGYTGGVAIAIETPTLGFNASVDGLERDGLTRLPGASGDALGWGTAHVTWAFLSEPSVQLRLEAGGSMLSMPRTGAFADKTHAGDVSFGPDVGVSGQLGLIGPIGLEGHARVTPLPIAVTDSRAAVAFRGGPLAVTMGWRAIHVFGDGTEAPSADFTGPELGLSFRF